MHASAFSRTHRHRANPLSPKTRQKSDIAHELAHTLLDHELSRVQRLGDVTFLSCDPVQEDEAAWLSGCLLLPRALLLAEVRSGATAKEIADKHGVSETMAKYRLGVTGVVRQSQAAIKKKPTPQ
jgi:Zn-dependent peptidase ImmA (M78 family)